MLTTTAAFFVILFVTTLGGNLNLAHAESDSGENAEWKLTVTGLVQRSLNLSLTDLFAMPKTSIYASLICAGPPSFLVTEGNWTGVTLWLILQEAGILNETVKIAFYAKDGYTTDLTPETVQHDDVLVAYEKDGAPLQETLRLVVPGRWGYKWISQITRVELVNYDFLGLYESRGYPDNGIGAPYLGPYPYTPNTPLPQSSNQSPTTASTSVPSASPSLPDTSSPSPLETSNQTEQAAETAEERFVPSPRFLYTLTAIIITIVIVVFLHHALARISLKTLFFGGKRV